MPFCYSGGVGNGFKNAVSWRPVPSLDAILCSQRWRKTNFLNRRCWLFVKVRERCGKQMTKLTRLRHFLSFWCTLYTANHTLGASVTRLFPSLHVVKIPKFASPTNLCACLHVVCWQHVNKQHKGWPFSKFYTDLQRTHKKLIVIISLTTF